MKKLLTLIIAALSTLSMLAGLNTMNYQAVINNADGNPASDTSIGLRFAIVAGDDILFAEETVVKSSSQGLVKWQIGSTVENGLSDVNWTREGLLLQVGIDLKGGSDYTTVYTSGIQSVPTAMYAAKSGDCEELREMVYDNRYHAEKNTNDIDRIQASVIDLEENAKELRDISEQIYHLTRENKERIEYQELNSSEMEKRIADLMIQNEEQQMRIDELRELVGHMWQIIEELQNK